MIELCLMASIVFFTRYFFLEPRLPIRLNSKLQKLLSYSSLAVLPAIAAPIIFIHQQQLVETIRHPYVIAAAIAVILSWKTRNVLLTTLTSMLILVFLLYYF